MAATMTLVRSVTAYDGKVSVGRQGFHNRVFHWLIFINDGNGFFIHGFDTI